MVINRKKHSDKSRAKQGVEEVISEPYKIGPTTPYDFEAKNLTATADFYQWQRCWRTWDSSNWWKKRLR